MGTRTAGMARFIIKSGVCIHCCPWTNQKMSYKLAPLGENYILTSHRALRLCNWGKKIRRRLRRGYPKIRGNDKFNSWMILGKFLSDAETKLTLMNICMCFKAMSFQSSLPLCSTPGAVGFRTEQRTSMVLFNVSLHICQPREISVTSIDLAGDTRSSIKQMGHGVVKGSKKDVDCDTQDPNLAGNRSTYSFPSKAPRMLFPHRPLSM